MDIIWSLIAIGWFIRILLNLFSYIHLWYVKEYRFDRMRIHLRTEQGKRIYFLPFKKPPVTPKTISLFFLSLLSILIMFYVIPVENILPRILLIDFLSFPITGFWVLLLRIPTLLWHDRNISLAVEKLRSHKPMLVIGITGSFGKTSTKEFLSAILSSKYKTLKTQESKNSPIGIAEVILTKLQPEHEAFIVEMGAYKKGEIAGMTRIVRPQIGIITAINAQHQDLFGSIDTTMSAKFELIEGLNGRMTGIFNADNNNSLKLAARARKLGMEVWLYSTNLENSGKKNYAVAKNIKSDRNGINFTAKIGKETAKFRVTVYGKHLAANMLGAITAAYLSGIKLKDAAYAATKIRPLSKTLEPLEGINGSLFINDTFNNNPDAAKAAINYLAEQQGRKFLVFQPMIELGSYADVSHEEIGSYAAKYCDEIILTNNNFYQPFIDGFMHIGSGKKVRVLNTGEATQFLKDNVKKGDTVLFKGKEAGTILDKLIKC